MTFVAQRYDADEDVQWHAQQLQNELDAFGRTNAYKALRAQDKRHVLEIRATVHGGLRILQKIEQADYDVFRRRPVLGRTDWLKVFWRALRPLPLE